MAYNYTEEFGKCKFCGAPMVKSPRTGKVFCSEKCWLKKQAGYNPSEAKEVGIERAQERKGESMRLMSSGRDAVQIVVAEMAQGGAWDEEMIKQKIESWKSYFYNKIYVDSPF